MTTLATLQAAHERTPHGDLAGAYRSAVDYLATVCPSYRPGKDRLATIRHAQGVLRRRQGWERSVMTGLMAKTRQNVRKAEGRAIVDDIPPDE